MNIQKACMICEQALATQSCQLCGRLVCESDFDKTKNVCSECLAKQAAP